MDGTITTTRAPIWNIPAVDFKDKVAVPMSTSANHLQFLLAQCLLCGNLLHRNVFIYGVLSKNRWVWLRHGFGFLFKVLSPGIAQNAKEAFLAPLHFSILPIPVEKRCAIICHGDFRQLLPAEPATPIHEFICPLFGNLFPGHHVITPPSCLYIPVCGR